MNEAEKTYARELIIGLDTQNIPGFVLTDGEIYTGRAKYRIVNNGSYVNFKVSHEKIQDLSINGFRRGLRAWIDDETFEWDSKYVLAFNHPAEMERISQKTLRKEEQEAAKTAAETLRLKEERAAQQRTELIAKLEARRKEITFQRKQFFIVREQSDMETVTGFVFGGIGIHEHDMGLLRKSKVWTITHITSGLSFGYRAASKRDAEFAIIRLCWLLDWDRPAQAVASDPKSIAAQSLVKLMMESGVFATPEKED